MHCCYNMWELKTWVNPRHLYPGKLYFNPNAVDYLDSTQPNLDYRLLSLCKNDDAVYIIPKKEMNWINLSSNSSSMAIYLLKQNMKKIDWFSILRNSNAIDIILEHLDEYEKKNNIDLLSSNTHPKAIEWLANHPNRICWYNLSANPSAMPLLLKYPEKIRWDGLSRNPSAIDMVLENPHKIYWSNLSRNPHPKAIEFLITNSSYIDWVMLSTNPSAEELFLLHPNKWYYNQLSENPCIFTYNYKKCRTVQRTTRFKEELLSTVLHPDRISKYLQLGYSLSDF
jgi:hypothetical protein